MDNPEISLREKFIDDIEKSITRLRTSLDHESERLKLIPSLKYVPSKLNVFEYCAVWSETTLYISIPWNLNINNKINTLLKTHGWYKNHRWNYRRAGQIRRYISYQHKKADKITVVIIMHHTEDSKLDNVDLFTRRSK